MESFYIKKTYMEATKAFKKKEVPVGCIIVENNKIIAKGHNLRESKKNSLLHAEIVAINKACKVKRNWRLNDTTLYVSLEPCLMCLGAIINSRIGKVVYFVKDEKNGAISGPINFLNLPGFNHYPEFVYIENKDSKDLLISFFSNLRKSKK